MTTHYEKAHKYWGVIEKNILAFGREMMLAIDTEEKTIRDMSVELCGNYGLEDRIGRYVMAARWNEALKGHPLHEEAMTWLTPTHFTELYKEATIEDTPTALDLMEQCLIRTGTEITEARPVDWLRSRRRKEEPDDFTIYHRLWKWATRALPNALSQIERMGRLADRRTLRRARLLKMVVREFSADQIASEGVPAAGEEG